MNIFSKFIKPKPDKALYADGVRKERSFLIWQNNDFFLRESYKTTRTNVMFSLTDTEGCRVISVTSTFQSEGKSITAANLAMSFADTGARVLLIDCDLRKPKLARLLQTKADNGLTDVLMDNSLLQTSIMQIREGKRLWLMTAGKIPPNPSELLGSETMKTLVEGLKKKFDYIIIDTPPVDMVTDALVMAPIIDGVLLVIRANVSDRHSLLHTIDQLEYAHAKILGIVFNGSDTAGGGYGYKKYGYSRYGYRRYGYKSYGYKSYGYVQRQPYAQNPAAEEEKDGESAQQDENPKTEEKND